MLFPTHLVTAYALGRRWDLPPYWVVAGAALPDLLDKPMAIAGVTDLYHSVGHSLLALAAFTVLVAVRREEPAVSVWIGWASHLCLDAVHVILNGRPDDVRFLAWPVVVHTPAVDLPPVAFAVHYLGTPSFYVEVVLWIAVVFLLLADRGADRPVRLPDD